jgi:hypothetical protein
MGQAIKAKIDGADINQARLGGGTETEIESPIDDLFHNGNFVTLKEMVKKAIVISADDPTATARSGSDVGYDLDNSGALIKYADVDGNVIEANSGSTALVNDVQVFVNLAGTADATSNTPYDAGEPFYYILMETDNSALADSFITIDLTQFPTGILATNDGGPQAEVSVILPQDAED